MKTWKNFYKMAAETSLWLDIISNQAKVLLVTERKQELQKKIQKAVEAGRFEFRVMSKYNFRSYSIHLQIGNVHNAPNSQGCGCAYCRKRHEYAKLKLELHRKSKSFERFLEYGLYGEQSHYMDSMVKEFNNEKAEMLIKIKKAKQELMEIKQDLKAIGYEIL